MTELYITLSSNLLLFVHALISGDTEVATLHSIHCHWASSYLSRQLRNCLLFKNPEIHYSLHKNPALDFMLSLINPVNIQQFLVLIY